MLSTLNRTPEHFRAAVNRVLGRVAMARALDDLERLRLESQAAWAVIKEKERVLNAEVLARTLEIMKAAAQTASARLRPAPQERLP